MIKYYFTENNSNKQSNIVVIICRQSAAKQGYSRQIQGLFLTGDHPPCYCLTWVVSTLEMAPMTMGDRRTLKQSTASSLPKEFGRTYGAATGPVI